MAICEYCKIEFIPRKDRVNRFCCKECALRFGAKSRMVKNKYIIKDGYCILLCGKIPTVIDIDDIEKIKEQRWARNGDYIRATVTRKILHRFIMNCDNDLVVHHLNHNKLDNRKSNLCIMSNSEHRKRHHQDKANQLNTSVNDVNYTFEDDLEAYFKGE